MKKELKIEPGLNSRLVISDMRYEEELVSKVLVARKRREERQKKRSEKTS
ncbi:hypothetical protein M1403_03865 [Patescibacteria group bacterium]|nr:hypothetical protein [Patescibacteria group bacterium]